MDIIIKSKGHGKTTDLVRMSNENNIPIATHDVNFIKDIAKKLNLTIPEPIQYSKIKQYPTQSVYIDELDSFLRSTLNCKVEAFTITLDDIDNR